MQWCVITQCAPLFAAVRHSALPLETTARLPITSGIGYTCGEQAGTRPVRHRVRVGFSGRIAIARRRIPGAWATEEAPMDDTRRPSRRVRRVRSTSRPLARSMDLDTLFTADGETVGDTRGGSRPGGDDRTSAPNRDHAILSV